MRQQGHSGKSRRNFLKSAGASALAPLAFRIIPASALGADAATPPSNRIALGCQSTIVSHLGCIAYWTGRALKWDPAGDRFLGDDEANRLRSRAMREPWRLV